MRGLYAVVGLGILCLTHCSGGGGGDPTVEITPPPPPQPTLQQRLETLDGVVSVTPRTPPAGFTAAYLIVLEQPLDHQHPDSGRFQQRVLLYHRDEAAPMVLDTEGYTVQTYTRPLAALLSANQLVIEHRYWGGSTPQPTDYQYLSLTRAAADHHRIVTLFKSIYSGKWVSTGRSKGGVAALVHRRLYPDDVDATVAFVAPILNQQLDTRIPDFIQSLGRESCGEALQRYQQLVLEHRDEILALWEDLAQAEQLDFTRVPLDQALEYAVYEYAPGFWQWRLSDCAGIPGEDASPQALFDELKKVVPIRFYADSRFDFLAAYYWMAAAELGEYPFLTSHLRHLQVADTDPSFLKLVPGDHPPAYNPAVTADVLSWLQTEAAGVALLYGQVDIWTAAAIDPAGNDGVLKLVVADGVHDIQIDDLSPVDRQALLLQLETLLDLTIPR